MASVLSVTLSGPDVPALFEAVASDPFFGFVEDVPWTVDGDRVEAHGDWRTQIARRTEKSAIATFDDDYTRVLALAAGIRVKATRPWDLDVDALVEAIARMPCTVACVGTLHRDWLSPDHPLPKARFGSLHDPYGPFVAFKGEAGHRFLVSRRWIDHGGPWLVHRSGEDLSVLQLHDLAADSRTAEEQVRRAQVRLGPGATGGYVWPGIARETKLDIQYSGRDRRASIVVAKRQVTAREMLDASLLRGSDLLGEGSPIDSVAFVYFDEGQARDDIHELWLRELECWTYIDGRETRIDEGYAPPPRSRPW